jgi:hypothetical protein
MPNAKPETTPTLTPGADAQVVPCLALFDTMKYIGSDVGTVGFGACMGMSGFMLAMGAKARARAAAPCSPARGHALPACGRPEQAGSGVGCREACAGVGLRPWCSGAPRRRAEAGRTPCGLGKVHAVAGD